MIGCKFIVLQDTSYLVSFVTEHPLIVLFFSTCAPMHLEIHHVSIFGCETLACATFYERKAYPVIKRLRTVVHWKIYRCFISLVRNLTEKRIDFFNTKNLPFLNCRCHFVYH